MQAIKPIKHECAHELSQLKEANNLSLIKGPVSAFSTDLSVLSPTEEIEVLWA